MTVGVTRGGKKGKTVTVVDGLDVGAAEDAKALVKKFKKILGSGRARRKRVDGVPGRQRGAAGGHAQGDGVQEGEANGGAIGSK